MATRNSPIEAIKKFYSFKTDFPVVDRSLVDNADIRIEASARVHVPTEFAFRVLADQRTWPEWYPTLRSVEWTSQPNAEGSTRLVKRKGRPSYEQQVIEWEEPFRMAFCIILGREPSVAASVEEFLLRPMGPAACELTWRFGAETAGIGKLVSPIFRGVMAVHPLAGTIQKRLPEKFASYAAWYAASLNHH